jgi:ferredoxin-NADP reductase
VTARSYRAVLERVEDIAPETRALFLRLPAGRGLEFLPGQFLSLSLPVGEKPLTRAYSVASGPGRPELLEICLNRVPGGAGSNYLFGLKAGAEVDFTGPWGTFVLDSPVPPSLVFIADGAGIAPLRPMVVAALASPELEHLHLLHAAADASGLLYRGEFEELGRGSARFHFEPLLEGGRAASHEALFAHVRERYVDGDGERRRHFFICGVGEIVTRLRDLLRGAGYERRAVHYEKW